MDFMIKNVAFKICLARIEDFTILVHYDLPFFYISVIPISSNGKSKAPEKNNTSPEDPLKLNGHESSEIDKNNEQSFPENIDFVGEVNNLIRNSCQSAIEKENSKCDQKVTNISDIECLDKSDSKNEDIIIMDEHVVVSSSSSSSSETDSDSSETDSNKSDSNDFPQFQNNTYVDLSKYLNCNVNTEDREKEMLKTETDKKCCTIRHQLMSKFLIYINSTILLIMN